MNKHFIRVTGNYDKKIKPQNYENDSPIGPHLGVPDILVLGISRPYLSTHQQNEVRARH